MADIDFARPPEPIGKGGGQGTGGAYAKMRRGSDGDDEAGADADGGSGGGHAGLSDDDAIDVADGLADVVSEKAQALIDRLSASIAPLESERDALKAEADRLRSHAEHAEHLGVASEYGVRTALGRVLSNRRHLSGVPGMVLVGVEGLEAVATQRGITGWRRAMRKVLDAVHEAAHSTDTVGVLASGQIAVVTLVGDHAALERLGRAIVAGIVQAVYDDGRGPWTFRATFGGAELHVGATVDQAFEAAEAARLAAHGPGDPAAVVVTGDASDALARAAQAQPEAPPVHEAVLSDEDMDRLGILGTIDPGRVPHLPPEREDDAKADKSGDDVG